MQTVTVQIEDADYARLLSWVNGTLVNRVNGSVKRPRIQVLSLQVNGQFVSSGDPNASAMDNIAA